MELKNIVTLEKHYFIKETNELLAVGDALGSATIKIKAKIDEKFNEDFCIDDKTFNYAKKLTTNRYFNVEDNKVTIYSTEGNLTAGTLDAPIPPFELGEVVFKQRFRISDLKVAAKYINNKWDYTSALLSGVIIDRQGCIMASNKLKLFYSMPYGVNELVNPVSIPVALIELLNDEDIMVDLEFSNNRVKAITKDMEIICSLYKAERFPNFISLADKARLGNIITVTIPKGLNIFTEADILKGKINTDHKSITYTLLSNDKTFEVVGATKETVESSLEFKTSYKDFIQAINSVNDDNIVLTITNGTILVNNRIILMQMKG